MPDDSPFGSPWELAAWSASLPRISGAPCGLQADGFVNVPDTPDIAVLAERVKNRRAEMGWTQADVAAHGGPSAGTVSEIERQRNPLPETLDKLDQALGWKPDTSDTILRGGVPGKVAAEAADRGRLRLVTVG